VQFGLREGDSTKFLDQLAQASGGSSQFVDLRGSRDRFTPSP
jgi:hypothetical protein